MLFHMHEIIGVVDGTHIAIVKPRVDEHMFINRKGYHSLNCQIVSNTKHELSTFYHCGIVEMRCRYENYKYCIPMAR